MLALQDWLRAAEVRLRVAGVPSPRHDAGALAQFVLKCDAIGLILRNEALKSAEWGELEAVLQRREAREPLHYITGAVEWLGRSLVVGPGVLVPRPETEILAERVFSEIAGAEGLRLLDIGTGSGALALSLKTFCPKSKVFASDISPEALEMAQRNARSHGLDIEFRLGHLWRPWAGMRFDGVVANLPYLPSADAEHLALESLELQHEPAIALYSGSDGLDLARELLSAAPIHLNEGGRIWLELDPRNAPRLANEAEAAGWSSEIFADLNGQGRFVRLVRQ